MKAFDLLPASCSNISHDSAAAFDSAYHRGWSGHTGRSSVRAYRSNDVAAYASHYYQVDPTRSSSSGWGSNLGPNSAISVDFLRQSIKKYGLVSMIDVPCGEYVSRWERTRNSDPLH